MSIDLLELIEALSRPEAYPHAVDAMEVHQTHISVVFLAGPFAYKIKKPVNLGFLDFSTLEKRKHFCEEEVRLNRRLAPNVYLCVAPIASSVATGGSPVAYSVQASRLHHDGASVVEWAVQMKRLPNDATLESRVDRYDVTHEHLYQLAERLAAFHANADANERISSFGRFDVIAQNARDNFTQAESHVGATVSREVFDRVRNLTEAHLARLHDLIESRAERGVPRDTHGDLHLDHVYLFPDESPPNDFVMIDCIEFTDRFRYADPVADVAFLAMDLNYHGRRDLARVLTDRYFQTTGDDEGRRLLPFYSAYRAVVRAKVKGIEQSETEIQPAERADAFMRAQAHWLVALGELEEPNNRPAVILIAGLPGSGKSTLAKSLAEHGNFRDLRSDVIRKELTKDERGNIYASSWTQQTYSEMLKRTEKRLWNGERVLIDANFREDAWRRRFLDLSKRFGVPILFVQCEAEPKELRRRLNARKGDVSDADWNTYQKLEATWEPLSDAIRRVTFAIDTTPGLAVSEASVRTKLQQEGLLE